MIIGFNENGIDEVNIHNHLMFGEYMETEGKYYYLFDGLGSVTGLTDENGNFVSSCQV